MYYLWSVKMNGWMTSSGVGTSNISDATKYTHAEALLMCKRHYKNGLTEFGLIPVSVDDIEEIRT